VSLFTVIRFYNTYFHFVIKRESAHLTSLLVDLVDPDNQTNTSSLNFYLPVALPDAQPSVKALKAHSDSRAKRLKLSFTAMRIIIIG